MCRFQNFCLFSNNQHEGTAGKRDFGSGSDVMRHDEFSQLRKLLETRITPGDSKPERVSAVVNVIASISIRIPCDLSPIAITLLV